MYSFEEIAQIIKKNDFFYILTHVYPDGDALGSAFALCRALQKLGKHSNVMLCSPIPEKFGYLKEYVNIQNFEPEFIISVDLADAKLLEPAFENYKEKIDICIDHHLSNKKYAKINYVENAAANCEIIYKLIKELNAEIDREIACALYSGIATDTGCFEYSNTTASSHLIAAELINLGAQVAEINERLFTIKTIKKLETEKIIYSNMKYFFGGKCAITSISLQEMQKIGISDGELDGMASIPIKVEGAEIGITIREKSFGVNKISVRTRKNVDANKFCECFGGGGHSKAAGFNLVGSIQEAENAILDVLKSQFGW